MNYVVFDLEWNQCPEGKIRENARLPFEIIEIGAWKLDENRKYVDQFHVLIKPQVYKRIHSRTRDVIHMDYKNLLNGLSFPAAVREFLEWCGEECVFCTWGDLDLMELQRNMKYYQMLHQLPGPIYYYDIQKLFSINHEDGRSRRSLEYGIDFLKLPKEDGFHRALEDAKYTALIFQKLNDEVIKTNYSVDVYQNPKKRKEELHLFYPKYEKYVSREFHSKEAAMKDREVTSSKCPYCHKTAKRKIRWFAANPKRYYSVSWCEEHGYIKGKIRMKRTDENKYYVIKTLRGINLTEMEEILKKQQGVQRRRKIKRQQENQEKSERKALTKS